MARSWGVTLLMFVVVGLLVVLMMQPVIRQSLAYHAFVDTRALLGFANSFDVLSNLPFLFVGVWGFRYAWTHRQQAAPWSWMVLFGGVALVSLGSAYYHLTPRNDTLVWDRLPMTIGFMGLLIALLSEYLHPKIERYLLVPAVLLGLGSVIYWAVANDLRLYIWVQAAPLFSILILLLVFKCPFSHSHYLVFSFVSYGLAKFSEHHDQEIFAWSQETVSGHTIKHLLAALGVFWLALWLRQRKRRKDNG